ncbi:MAG: hypothetical protein U1E06_14850 [Tabrizicola sp.]|nr:hypothetical protein [Tabrizicola sp.]
MNLGKKTGWHYSDAKYGIGDLVSSYDNWPGLDPSLHAAERIVRSSHPDGVRIRSNAVYLWENEEVARRIWAAAGKAKKAKKYLYTVEYGQSDILHRGDLNHYTSVQEGDLYAQVAAAESYWAGSLYGEQQARVEVLVRSATVIAAESYSVPLPETWSDADLPF